MIFFKEAFVKVMDNELNKNNNDNEGGKDNELNISYEDLMLVASGTDEEGKPVSIVTIAVDRIDDENEQVADNTIMLDKAVFNFYVSGGCLVAEGDFPDDGSFQYGKVIEYLSTYLDNMQDEEYAKHHVLGVVIVPMCLDGKVSVVMPDLVYFTGMDLPDSQKRLIMCFNDLQSQVVSDMDIDIEEIEKNVRAEIYREQKRTEQEIAAINKEMEDLNNANPYQQNIMDRYSGIPSNSLSGNAMDDANGGGGQDMKNTWMRTSKD